MNAIFRTRGELPLRTDIPGAEYWSVALERAMLSYFEVAPHTRFERHAHESEQITLVLEGTLFFELEDRVYSVTAGDVIALPAHVPHAVYTTALPAKAVDAWSPVPARYREGDAH